MKLLQNDFISKYIDIFFSCSVKLYAESLARFQGGSPYIYPLYGLGELPQVWFFNCNIVYMCRPNISCIVMYCLALIGRHLLV